MPEPKNFIEAVNAMKDKMTALSKLQTQPPPLSASQVASITVSIVRKNNVELARVFRQNPVLIKGPGGGTQAS